MNRVEGIAVARAEHERLAAKRALNDPVKLARAVRIVQAALAEKLLTMAELQPMPAPSAQTGPNPP